MNSQAKDKKVSELIPNDSRQQAAKFLLDSMSPEEKEKLLNSMKNEINDKKSNKE